jgi:hypothetical protein
MTDLRRAGLLAALLAGTIAVAACGGGTTTTASAGAPEPATSTEPTTAPESVAPASAEPSSALAIPSFDLSALVTNLENIDSYRLTITSGGETQYSGIVVTQPELARDVTVSGQRIVMIGDEVWIGTPGGDDLTPAPEGMAQALLSMVDPVMLVGAFATPGAMTGATAIGSEDKNGVAAQHFRIDSSSFIGAMASMPPGSSIDVWIADDGYLVSLAVSGIEDSDFVLDVTDVNSPANVVERPS